MSLILFMAGVLVAQPLAPPFDGTKAGDERTIAGVKFSWCPAGKFTMGSPRTEPDRRPDEDQVEVTLTKGFWTAKYETTQGQWKRVAGKLPGAPTADSDPSPAWVSPVRDTISRKEGGAIVISPRRVKAAWRGVGARLEFFCRGDSPLGIGLAASAVGAVGAW